MLLFITGCGRANPVDPTVAWRQRTVAVLEGGLQSAGGKLPDLWLPHGRRSLVEQASAIIALSAAGARLDGSALAAWRADRDAGWNPASSMYRESGEDDFEVTRLTVEASRRVGDVPPADQLAAIASAVERAAGELTDNYRIIAAASLLASVQSTAGGAGAVRFPRVDRRCKPVTTVEELGARAELRAVIGERPCEFTNAERQLFDQAWATASSWTKGTGHSLQALQVAQLRALVAAAPGRQYRSSDPRLRDKLVAVSQQLAIAAGRDMIEQHPVALRVYDEILATIDQRPPLLGPRSEGILRDILVWGGLRSIWQANPGVYAEVAETIDLLTGGTLDYPRPRLASLSPGDRVLLQVRLRGWVVEPNDVQAAAQALIQAGTISDRHDLQRLAAVAQAARRLNLACTGSLRTALRIGVTQLVEKPLPPALQRLDGDTYAVLEYYSGKCPSVAPAAEARFAQLEAKLSREVSDPAGAHPGKTSDLKALTDAVRVKCAAHPTEMPLGDAPIWENVQSIAQPEGGASTRRFDVDPALTLAVAYLVQVRYGGCPAVD
ncbi:hypothetical protein ACQPXM_31410 [Kribbella sp. CA-253562]|uniref:hypothetical protein n=1 Tax=Kribbella sp. CA-253562 TaxID=3239942 RepID=UPI003D8AD761